MGSQQMPMHPGHGQLGYGGKSDQVMAPTSIEDPYLNADMGADGLDTQALEEERMRAEENIYNTHLDAVKEEV